MKSPMFGERLSELRVKAGLSQRQLAELAGLTYAVIVSWEQGRRQPSLEGAHAVAKALGLTVDELTKRPNYLRVSPQFGARLRSAREAIGMTQSELARKSRSSLTMIWKWETGVSLPRLISAVWLAKAVGVPLGDFLDSKIAAKRAKQGCKGG